MFVHTETQSLCFKAPDPFLIRSLLPQSQTLWHEDYNVAVKHTWDNIRVLRNLGFDAPTPSGYMFPGKRQPKPHQLEMFEFFRKHHRCFNLSEPGTMKT